MCASIICGCDCAKPFLAGRVPNLQFDTFAIHFNSSDFEIDANGCNVVAGKCIVGKSDQERAFSHSGIADDQELEKMIVITMRSHFGLFLTGPEKDKKQSLFIIKENICVTFYLDEGGKKLFTN